MSGASVPSPTLTLTHKCEGWGNLALREHAPCGSIPLESRTGRAPSTISGQLYPQLLLFSGYSCREKDVGKAKPQTGEG